MTWIKTGTVSINNSTNVLNGVGTSFVDVGILSSGDMVFLPNVAPLEVLSIQSNTQILLVGNYIGTNLSGSTYSIIPLGMLPSAVALSVKNVLTAQVALMGNTILATAAQGLTSIQQGNARANIAALGASDVGSGRLVKSVAGGVDVTLSAAEAENEFIELTGTLTANINVIVPSAARKFFFYNGTSGAFTLTVKTAAGSGVAVMQGGRTMLECDATNVVNPLSYLKSSGVTEDAAGNVGVGVTPSPWDTTFMAVQLGASSVTMGGGAIFSQKNGGFSSGLVTNVYYSSAAWRYAAGITASKYEQNGGSHLWSTAPSGTAGAAITWVVDATLSSAGLLAGIDNTQTIGSATYRWSTVYAGTGSINTSDAREKTPVRGFTSDEINASKQLSKEIGAYQFLSAIAAKGDSAREHIGMTVQRVIEIMTANQIDPFGYGFVCHDAWEDAFVVHAAIDSVAEVLARPAVLDANGVIVTPAIEAKSAVEAAAAWTEQTQHAGDRYAFRTDELLMFIARGFESRLTALEAISHG